MSRAEHIISAGNDPVIMGEFLKRLWAEICQLKPGHRFAYLLNFTDADGEIELFSWYGIATIDQIGKILEISDKQFESLWRELPLDDDARQIVKGLKTYD